jgi:outer membrane protein insertion porin family
LSDGALLRHQLPVPAVRPLWRKWLLSFNATVGLRRAAWASTTALPPYLNYFAGGPDSVRGYRESRLGPRDNIGIGNPYGGNLRVVAARS